MLIICFYYHEGHEDNERNSRGTAFYLYEAGEHQGFLINFNVKLLKQGLKALFYESSQYYA